MKSIILTLALLLPTSVWAANDAETGRSQLWHNQTSDARTTFRAALKKDATDVEALRGLGWAALFEDDEKGALLALRPLFRLAPSQPQTAALWPQFARLCEENGRPDLLEGAARDIMASTASPPELRASARLVLADAAHRDGKIPQAKTLLDSLAFVRVWRAIGPFDNAARSGFNKAYAPENEFNFAKKYKGKNEQAERWRALSLVTQDGECEVGRHIGDESPSVFYAATAVFSPQAQSAVLRFDPLGASKIWLNSALILNDNKVRARQRYVADLIRVPVSLKAGWNSLLVKIADDGTDDAAFALRFTTREAVDLPLRADASQFQYVPLNGSAPQPELPIIGALRGPQVFDPENAALLAAFQRESGEAEAAIQTLRGALAQNAPPQSAWLYWELARSFSADGRPDEARAARNRAIALNPRLVPAQLDAIADAESSASARVQKLKAFSTNNPQSAMALRALIAVCMQVGAPSDALAASRRLADLAPGAENFVVLFDQLNAATRKREAERTLLGALKKFPDSENLLRAKAERRVMQGRGADAIAAYRKLLAMDTPQPGYLLSLADLQEKALDFKGAITSLQNLRTLRPQDASIAVHLADLLRTRGDKTGALALYREAIGLAPWQVALREKLQTYSSEKTLFELVPSLNEPLIAKTPPSKRLGTSAIILLDEARQLVYPDGATFTRYRQVVNVFDATAVAHYRNFDLALPTFSATATIESAKITSASGKSREIAQIPGSKRVSLPSLALGDVLDVTYRVEDFQTGGLSQQFWTQWFFRNQAPVKTSRFVLITPPELVFNVRSHGEIPRLQMRELKSKNGAWRVREWRIDNLTLPKIAPSSASSDSETWLDISSVGSWKQIADWYRDLSAPRCVPDGAIRAKAAELTKTARDGKERLRSIYDYVSRDVQNQSTPFRSSAYLPVEGKQVLRDKYGDAKDKAALLCALYSAVGIKAHMVLLSGQGAGITPFLPSPRFDSALVVADTPDGPLWLDCADRVPFGDLPAKFEGVPALIISDSTTGLTTSPVHQK